MNPEIGYDERNGFWVSCTYGYVDGVPDRCFGCIKVNENGYLTMEMSHVMEYDQSKGMVNQGEKEYLASLYVKKEIFDEIGLERGNFSYRDKKEYQRRVTDREPRNHWGEDYVWWRWILCSISGS